MVRLWAILMLWTQAGTGKMKSCRGSYGRRGREEDDMALRVSYRSEIRVRRWALSTGRSE